MKFEELGLAETVLRAVGHEGYEIATPIQIQAIPPILKGRDLMGCAQTGTGKTAAFALPTLQRLSAHAPIVPDVKSGFPTADEVQAVVARQGFQAQTDRRQRDDRGPRPGQRPGMERNPGPAKKIRALILSPTRELAAQIGDSFRAYGRFTGLKHTTIFGGVSQVPQVRDLRFGVDIMIATPGRLLDLMQQGYIDLSGVEILILDEADQMLDMGFIIPLRKIVASVPRRRQTLMFSATMPPEILKLASEWLRDPIHIQVAPVATPAEKIEQSVFFVDVKQKPFLLSQFIKSKPNSRMLVFSRTKHGADKIVKHLHRDGINAEAIHGNKSQGARQRVLQQFKTDRLPVLVATDIAARGLDIDAITHVINYDMPDVAETYVHRIGRTARAGAEGVAIAFCSKDERYQLRLIERLIRRTIPVEKMTFDLHAGEAQKRINEHHSNASTDQPRSVGGEDGAGQSRPPQHQRPAQSGVAQRPQLENGERPFRKYRNTGGRSSGPQTARSGSGLPAKRFGKPLHRRDKTRT